MIQLIDYKGDRWDLGFVKCDRGMDRLTPGGIVWYSYWYTFARPRTLKEYEIIKTPIFTDWF